MRSRRPLPRVAVPVLLLAVVGGVVVGSAGLRSLFAIPATTPSFTLAVGSLSISPDLTLAKIPIDVGSGLTAVGSDGPIEVVDRVVTVPLRFADSAEKQTVTVRLEADELVGEIEINFYPRSYYHALGSAQPAVVLMHTTLPRMGELVIGAGVSDDPPGRPSLRVDRERWAEARLLGVMPPATLDRDEQLRQLLVRLEEGNRPSVGRLCDETRPGLDTYRRVSAGECFIWCTGYSRIIRDFLRSAGVPSRLIDLSPQVVTLDGGVTVQSSEAHQTTEQWDRDRWVWIDGTMGVLRALDPDGNALSTRQVVAALGSTPTRDALRFVRLDPASGGWSVRSYQDQDDPFRLTLAATLTPDKIMAIPNGGFG